MSADNRWTCWQIESDCLHRVFLLAAAALVMVAVDLLGRAAKTDWELGGGLGLSQQNILPQDGFSN